MKVLFQWSTEAATSHRNWPSPAFCVPAVQRFILSAIGESVTGCKPRGSRSNHSRPELNSIRLGTAHCYG